MEGEELDDIYCKGRDLYKIGNFNQALINFKNALDEDPNNLNYLYALGKTYAFRYDSEKNYKESLFYYNKVLEINPNHIKALIVKSLSLVNLGKTNESLKIIDEGIKNSNDGYLWAMKGRLLSFLHKKDNEITNCFQKAYEQFEDTTYLDYLRAKAYEYNLDYNNASKCYDKSIENINESVCDLDEGIYVTLLLIMLEKGWMYIRSGDLDKALECFEEVLKINSKSIPGLYSKAYVYNEQGHLEDALNVLKDSLYLDPKDILSLNLKATIYIKESRQTAMGIYQRILDIDETNGLALMNMSWVNYQEKEYEKALNMAKKALEIEPMSGFALYFGSVSARKTGNINLARKWERNLSDPRVNTIFLEKNLQDKIVNEPWRLKKAGYNLKFNARELNLKDRPGRLDLLYQDDETDDFVVIELKVVPATKKTYEQIKDYMDSINKTIGFGKIVKGIVISLGQDGTFKNLLENDPDVSQINYQKLGLG